MWVLTFLYSWPLDLKSVHPLIEDLHKEDKVNPKIMTEIIPKLRRALKLLQITQFHSKTFLELSNGEWEESKYESIISFLCDSITLIDSSKQCEDDGEKQDIVWNIRGSLLSVEDGVLLSFESKEHVIRQSGNGEEILFWEWKISLEESGTFNLNNYEDTLGLMQVIILE